MPHQAWEWIALHLCSLGSAEGAKPRAFAPGTMPDEGAPSPLAEQLAARPLPQPIVTLPTYTTANALALFARLLEAIGYHATHSALLQEAGDRREALTQRAASLSEVCS